MVLNKLKRFEFGRIALGTSKSLINVSGTVKILNPEGLEFVIDNINAFARLHLLDPSQLCRVIKGKSNSIKGWKIQKEGK